MGNFVSKNIDKPDFDETKIYLTKADALKAYNGDQIDGVYIDEEHQKYWGDEEGLTAQIYPDGTVLILENGIAMGWTTCEALGIDENGEPLIVDIKDITAEDIQEGEYVECTQDGKEGYAINVNGTAVFLSKNNFATDQKGHLLYTIGDKYIYIDTNTGTALLGLTETNLINYAAQNGGRVYYKNGIATFVSANGIYTFTEENQFSLGEYSYLIDKNSIIQINPDGSVEVAKEVTLPNGTDVDVSWIQGTADYNGEKVVVCAPNNSPNGQAIIIYPDGRTGNVSRSNFSQYFSQELTPEPIEEVVEEPTQPSTTQQQQHASTVTTPIGELEIGQKVTVADGVSIQAVSEDTFVISNNNGIISFDTDGKTYFPTEDGGWKCNDNGITYIYNSDGSLSSATDNNGNFYSSNGSIIANTQGYQPGYGGVATIDTSSINIPKI